MSAITLTYNDSPIHIRDEMLCLTDMWKAAGSPDNREPYQWARKEGSAFIEAIAEMINLPVEQVLKTKQGKGGGSWGHWQIGFAYAKYLSPEFHAWCNTAAREKLEGAAPRQVLVTGLDEGSRKVIGGMIHSSQEKYHGQTRKILDGFMAEVRGLIAVKPVGIAVETHRTALGWLEHYGVKKRKRGLSRTIGDALAKISAQHGVPLLYTAEEGKRSFSALVAQEYFERGAGRVLRGKSSAGQREMTVSQACTEAATRPFAQAPEVVS